MAKKKKGKVIQMLSPENYIKQRARTLPIYECRINSDWEINKLANIFVARKHTNGNLTVGLYLVDLKCLGVKDAYYFFNISEVEYEELIEKSVGVVDLDHVPYPLVHNIIYAGVEFAEEYGFKPCKEYASVAKYILEEDTEDIELIDIDCGENGKPFYISGPFESEERIKQIIDQLERTAGKGNYDFIYRTDEDVFDSNASFDNFEEKFIDFSFQEKVNRMIEIIESSDIPTDEELEEFDYLLYTLFENLIDIEEVERLYDNHVEMIRNYQIDDELSDELLGIQPNSNVNREEWEMKFYEIFDLVNSNPKKALNKLKNLNKQMPDNPAVHFLILNAKYSEKEYDKLLEKYFNLHPDYPLLKMQWKTHQWIDSEGIDLTDIFEQGPEFFFRNRKSIHVIELLYYLMSLITIALKTKKFEIIEMISWLMVYLETPELLQNLTNTIDQLKFAIILSNE